tara:strand:- start:3843 stop:4889 length:1047 start_codon:yes stop_codon:yes gene_type:complete
MTNYKQHIINENTSIKKALIQLDKLAKDAILFIVDNNDKLIGSLTDGDVRRGLIKGISLQEEVLSVIQQNPKFIRKGKSELKEIIEYRNQNLNILPVLDDEDHIISVVNFGIVRSYLPLDAVIMAGGKGTRLMPLTETTPKPLLNVGDKPIMEHNLERLALYGIDNFWISVRYLGEQIEAYFGDGRQTNKFIDYVWEDTALGTIGAVSKIKNFRHDYVLITNSDILTNLDYESFFVDFIDQDADLSVVTIPYQVNIPYAVLETNDRHIIDFKEKPTYTYYSNGGIYLIKKKWLDLIPKNFFFNATDLMEKLIENKCKVISYPLTGYWLDIGQHKDFEKAQKDIHKVKF